MCILTLQVFVSCLKKLISIGFNGELRLTWSNGRFKGNPPPPSTKANIVGKLWYKHRYYRTSNHLHFTRPNMEFHVMRLREAFPTLLRYLVTVNEHVLFEPSAREEGLRALIAVVRTLSGVFSHVNRQVALCYEAPPAPLASVRTLPGVASRVEPQLPRGQKSLPTFGTQVVPLSFMHQHVPGPVMSESLPTNVTLVGPVSSVSADVRPHRGRMNKAPSAV